MVTRGLVEAHDAVLVLKDMPFRANDPDFVCKYKDIIMLEKEELHARIEKSAAHIWLDEGYA
ncbi:MAG: hypothetical protein ACUVQ6_07520 [Dissulfurimicrobium sp.]|uniref:hypothetical protein n=1 Tax=Dissulfurimicrobium sp. TaxID=2022436 RepID=UPI0040493148